MDVLKHLDIGMIYHHKMTKDPLMILKWKEGDTEAIVRKMDFSIVSVNLFELQN